MEPRPQDDGTPNEAVFSPELIAARQETIQYATDKAELVELFETNGITVLPGYKDSDDRFFTDELRSAFNNLAQSGEYGADEEIIEELGLNPNDYSIILMSDALLETRQLWRGGDEIAALDTRNLILGQIFKSQYISYDTTKDLVSIINEYLSDSVGEIELTPDAVVELIKRAETNEDNLDAYSITGQEIAMRILNEYGEHEHLGSLTAVIMAIAEYKLEKNRFAARAIPNVVYEEDPVKEAKLKNALAQANEYASKMGISSTALDVVISFATAGLFENGYEPIV